MHEKEKDGVSASTFKILSAMIKTSTFWKAHFTQNLKQQRIDWSREATISSEEKSKLLYSIKAFQLGETGDGEHFLAAVRRRNDRIGEPEYVEAAKLFVKEEQKHGANLGRYLDTIGEARATADLGDWFFRHVRHFNRSLELWTITIIIVECAAQIFYQAVHDATRCELLRDICKDILIDEAHHIKFQNERLFVIFQDKGFYARAIAVTWYCLLFFATAHAVWIGHRRAFMAGGVDMKDFMRSMYYKFFKSLQFIHGKQEVESQPVLQIVRG